jgi:hypothetical protein
VLLSARHGRKGTLSPDTNQPPVAFAFQLKLIEMKSPTERDLLARLFVFSSPVQKWPAVINTPDNG